MLHPQSGEQETHVDCLSSILLISKLYKLHLMFLEAAGKHANNNDMCKAPGLKTSNIYATLLS